MLTQHDVRKFFHLYIYNFQEMKILTFSNLVFGINLQCIVTQVRN